MQGLVLVLNDRAIEEYLRIYMEGGGGKGGEEGNADEGRGGGRGSREGGEGGRGEYKWGGRGGERRERGSGKECGCISKSEGRDDKGKGAGDEKSVDRYTSEQS